MPPPPTITQQQQQQQHHLMQQQQQQHLKHGNPYGQYQASNYNGNGSSNAHLQQQQSPSYGYHGGAPADYQAHHRAAGMGKHSQITTTLDKDHALWTPVTHKTISTQANPYRRCRPAIILRNEAPSIWPAVASNAALPLSCTANRRSATLADTITT